MEERRSAIPKVVGILMIVFASLGLLHTLVTVIQAQLFKEMMGTNSYTRVMLIFGLLDFGIGILHLAAGLKALAYKDSAPRLATLYAVLKITTTLGLMVVTYAFMRPATEGIGGGEAAVMGMVFVMMGVFYLAWPIVALVLMTRPRAKAACVNI